MKPGIDEMITFASAKASSNSVVLVGITLRIASSKIIAGTF
jgi:hypothetical protein